MWGSHNVSRNLTTQITRLNLVNSMDLHGVVKLALVQVMALYPTILDYYQYKIILVNVMNVQETNPLTHWGRVKHICVIRLTITGSDNGLSPGRRQAIIWTNAGILLIGSLGTNFGENLIEILTFSFTIEIAVCEMAVILSRSQCVNWVWK